MAKGKYKNKLLSQCTAQLSIQYYLQVKLLINKMNIVICKYCETGFRVQYSGNK